MSRVQLFDHAGFKVCELDADAPRSWAIGKYGSCKFTIPVNSDKCRKRYIQFGNYVLIEHEKLPSWGGVIDTPRTWGNNKVEITAYSAEYILNFRNTGWDTLKVNPGAMFKVCIDIANRVQDTRLIKAGPIDETGASIKFELKNGNLYDFVTKKIGDAGVEWRITPIVTNKRLTFEATLYEKFEVTTEMTLSEGYNIESNDNVLVEDGDIYNTVIGIGKGSSWSSRYKYTVTDIESEAEYGYRETALDVDEGNKANVEKYTAEHLETTKDPLKKFDVRALDFEDTWKFLDLGHIMRVELAVCGFEGDKKGTDANIRIIGMSYDENDGTVRLICEEHNDTE